MTGSKTNSMTREQILAALKTSPPQGDFVWDGVDDDDRPLTRSEMQQAINATRKQRGRPAGSDKTQIALRVDNDTLAAFRAMGNGWQTRMNAALNEWLKEHSKAE